MKANSYYSCVVDSSSVFYFQTWGLVNSLIKMAKIPPSHIFVHYTKEADRIAIEELTNLDVNLIPIARFGDGKYCNKLIQLDTKEFEDADYVFLMDADMIVLGELFHLCNPNAISGKVVDLANPDLSILKNLFDLAGFKGYPIICNVDCGDGQTFQNNLNGGLYVVPRKFILPLRDRWKKWALWLLDNIHTLEKENKQNHVDQISFSLATFDLSIPVINVERKYNYPLHLPIEKFGNPIVLHYHRNISKLGLIYTEGECDKEFHSAIQNANNLIGSFFNNKIFWSFRYEMFPELGSGIGSREQNMEYKRSLLQEFGIEESPSILDVGCGDIEVIKTLNVHNYTGIDTSPEAIRIAKEKRPDLNFFQVSDNYDIKIPSSHTVLCFEVLIHQKTYEEYIGIINLLAAKTTRRLIVSGYTSKQLHHETNHMLKYHESLIDSLTKTKKFSTVRKIGYHSDVDIIMAEIQESFVP